MKIDAAIVANRKLILDKVGNQLKTEFYGLDHIIDKVISSVYAWYVFPELIKRPVIVNLWGMTGVGKTQLVRRLVALLAYSNKFVEVQMDGTSGGSMYRQDSICSILSGCIDEGEAGILLLDEIQRFRTISDSGDDIKVERYQDVWMLLSDGKFAANSDMFLELEMMIAYQLYAKDEKDDQPEKSSEKSSKKSPKEKPKKIRKFQIYPYEAKNLKRTLRLSESITEIMTWDAKKVESLLQELRSTRIDWQIDYTKLLIFVSGNLDSAFTGSQSTEDSDTDADFYHQLTSQLTTTEIKQSLGKRFKPEQISRLGSNHIIYPSMSKLSYERLIQATCLKYIEEMKIATNINFEANKELYDVIYHNSVYPTQGTRPVFSAIHKIFSTGLVNIACWCLEHNIYDVVLKIDVPTQTMIAIDRFTRKQFSTFIDLEISTKKAKRSLDIKTLIAVHESGHALLYALLTKSAPIECKINAISFAQGYILPNENLNTNNTVTKTSLRNRIAIALGGLVAEELFFGAENRTIGCASDITFATYDAARYVRHYGYNETLALINSDAGGNGPIIWNTDLTGSNILIEQILAEERDRAMALLQENLKLLKKIINELLEQPTLNQQQFIQLVTPVLDLKDTAYVVPFNDLYLKHLN